MHSSKTQYLQVYVQDSLKRAGLLRRQTNFWCTLCCVLVCCAVLCCVWVVSGDLFGAAIWAIWRGHRGTYFWHGTGSALLFVYVSSRLCSSFRIFSRFSPPLRAERVGRRDDFLRFFPSLLFFSRLFSLLPDSAGGPAGRLLTFLPVSSPFFVCAQSGAVGFILVFVNV